MELEYLDFFRDLLVLILVKLFIFLRIYLYVCDTGMIIVELLVCCRD